MDNGWNFTSKKFTSLEKYGVEHTKCSPHHHQGNEIAKKSVDTLKCVMQKVPTPTVEEACFKLNSRIRRGAKANPLSCFFGRKTKGDLPNMFNKVCHIMETVERHIKNQFEIAQRREHLSWDVFKVGDRVCLRNQASTKWDILGKVVREIEADDGSIQSSEVATDPKWLGKPKKWQKVIFWSKNNKYVCL